MDPRKQAVRGLLDEFLAAIKQSDKTPIVPAPNRWFAKPEEFPHVQPMVEKALAASGKTRDDFLHGAFLDPRTGQDLTGRMMSDVGVLIDPRTGRPMMSGRESGMEEFAELEKRLGNQTMSNLVRRSKFKPTGGDTLLNEIPFIATVEQGPHYYGLGTEYASPTQLFQVQTGSNPHLRPKSRGDVFGMGEVVGRMQIGKGPEHDVYEKLFVAPRGSDVPGKKLNKAEGGEVHMDKGGDPMLADLIERYNTPRNKSRYSAGIFDSNAPGEVRSVTPTVKERMASGLQSAMERAGSDRSKARQRAQTIVGGPNSRLPGGFGVADIGAMVNPTVAAAMIPVYAESAMHDLAGVPDALKRGDYVGAGVDTAFGLMDLIPAVGQGKQVAKGVAKGIKNAVTSDAGYDLAQRVLNATGTAPAQIMMGENSKTWNHGNAALAKHMELQGADPMAIWEATGTFRGADGKLRQEIPDWAMEYTPKVARQRQTNAYTKRRDRALAAATTPEEAQDIKDFYKPELKNAIYNLKGKMSEFVDHPELRAAYPELFNREFKQLEPDHPEFTSAQDVSGFFDPKTKAITLNGDFPENDQRDTALHELQHAIQQLEGWQGGASPALMSLKMFQRDQAKDNLRVLERSLEGMRNSDPIKYASQIQVEEQMLKKAQDELNKTKQLENISDPFRAYERAAGEEEARAVERRSRLSDEELKEWHPSENYDTPFSEHITDFATGGAVMMAGGKDVTKEAIKQGVKKGINAIDEFLSSLKPGEKPATAANRVAAGNKAAAMIKKDPPIKASEALGQQMEQGFKKVSTTQSDRTRVGKGNIGGASFPALSRVDPRYEGKVWGVMDSNTAKRLTNLSTPDTLWTTMLGSADQLKTNPVVFDSLESQFRDAMAAGLLKPDLEGKINQNLRLFLGEGADIRDPEIWKALDTFEKRASMADIMMGKGEPPSKGGVPLGGEKSGKGVIFNPSETLIEETELGLLHPQHGGYVPTYALGPRLFTLDSGTTYRPDLHPGFPTLLTGEDRGVNMIPTPTEVFLPDWHQHFKNTVAQKNIQKVLEGKKPRTAPAGYYDLALGLEGEGLPSQELSDDYIRHLIREGYAEGGEVHMDKGGSVKNAVKDVIEGLRGYVDPIATKISEWNWRPMTDVRQDVPDTEVPEYIQKGYGDFMAEQAKRAAAGNLNARDLIKAYTITRSSVNRGGLPYNTATKTGMQLPRTQGLVRPEGAFSEWLGSPAGQRYLDDAVLGKFDEKDLEDMVTRFGPFGMPAVLADDMRYAARSLSPKGATISADVMASPEQYRETSQQLKGIGPAKSGFMASLLGRGDYPTFDARQIRLHTGQGGKDAAKYMTRGKGVGGEEAVARLADRQRAMDMSLDPSLDPFYQHLVHHTVWDKLGNEQTTHDDLVKAMRGYADGGEVELDGVTLDDFLSKQGY
jgi:hypothetical protein